VLLAAIAIGACREESRPAIPPVTTAPSGGVILTDVQDAGNEATSAPSAEAKDAGSSGLSVEFADLPIAIPTPCAEIAIAMVSGSGSALGEKLAAGDVLVVRQPAALEVKGTGVAVRVVGPERSKKCTAEKHVVRVTPDVVWAKGAFHARLQVGEKQQSSFYLGRLEGTAPVAEHVHKGTWEILAAVDAAGTFVIDGKDVRVGPRQVVVIPPDTKHAWKPDPGHGSLQAVQIYSPPGPEQRFLALAAAEKDGG
jgi:mannose-6-phosphate isomerase-like protein (cupin superfamily)